MDRLTKDGGAPRAPPAYDDGIAGGQASDLPGYEGVGDNDGASKGELFE